MILHESTAGAVARLIATPKQAVLLVGPRGMGKVLVAKYIAQNILGQNLDNYPYFRHIVPEKPDSIGIDQIRSLQGFLTLKVPGKQAISRIVLIEDAHLLTLESQNALLKTLEEPPEGTMLLLTAADVQALLPTIRSRLQTLSIIKPPTQQLTNFLVAEGYASDMIKKALQLSGNLPGLTTALLQNDSSHPLYEATTLARTLLQSSRFEKLAKIDSLSKQKQLCLDVLYILQHMAHTTLLRGTSGAAEARWSTVLKASYDAELQLLGNGQPKLVLTNFMLKV
jgi:DNA polymerase-3 subunit delta'